MAYRLCWNLDLGETGLTLSAQLVSSTGANVGSAITTGFTEIGGGHYLWDSGTNIPDGHRGGVKFLAGSTLKQFGSINPEEAENQDRKATLAAAAADYTTARATKLDQLDASVASRLAASAYTAPPSLASIIAGLWNEALSAHTTAGSAGKKLADIPTTGGGGSGGTDPLTTQVPGSYDPGTAGRALGRIGSGQVDYIGPVAISGDITVVRGDDYNNTDSRALEWTSTGWPDLTGATVTFRLKHTSGVLTKAATVVTPTGTARVRVELASADTAGIVANSMQPYRFDVEATLSSGRKVTLLTGWAKILEDVT